MSVGALLGSFSSQLIDDPGNGVATQLPVGRWVAYLLIVLGMLESNVLNIYSTYMSSTTIFTGFNGAVRLPPPKNFYLAPPAFRPPPPFPFPPYFPFTYFFPYTYTIHPPVGC